MKKIGFVTYRGAPRLTADDTGLIVPLREQGYEAVPVIWDAHGVDWEAFDALLLRSCWDYHLRAEAFLEWMDHLDRLGVAVWNPTTLLRWNMNKIYLNDLVRLGMEVPRTAWIEAGARPSLESVLREYDLDEVVVKPTVSATAWHTWRTNHATAARDQDRFAGLVRAMDVMVQAFVPEVVCEGEWSLVFFNGRYSHAVLKRARRGDFRVQSEYGGEVHRRHPPGTLVEQAQALIQALDPPGLYARVDGVAQGERLVILELELIDPELFLRLDPAFARRFAAEIATVV